MAETSSTPLALLATLLLWFVPTPLTAQTAEHGYAGLTLGSYSVVADTVKATTSAVGALVGFALLPWLDVEAELIRPTQTLTRKYEGVSVSFAGPDASRAEVERLSVVTRYSYERMVRFSVSGAAIFHPRSRGRWSPGVIAGLTAIPVRERYTTEPVHVPVGVDPNQPSVRATSQNVSQTRGGLTIGGRLALAVTSRLVIAPDLRLDYGSIGDEIDNVVRFSTRIVWRF